MIHAWAPWEWGTAQSPYKYTYLYIYLNQWQWVWANTSFSSLKTLTGRSCASGIAPSIKCFLWREGCVPVHCKSLSLFLYFSQWLFNSLYACAVHKHIDDTTLQARHLGFLISLFHMYVVILAGKISLRLWNRFTRYLTMRQNDCQWFFLVNFCDYLLGISLQFCDVDNCYSCKIKLWNKLCVNAECIIQCDVEQSSTWIQQTIPN